MMDEICGGRNHDCVPNFRVELCRLCAEDESEPSKWDSSTTR